MDAMALVGRVMLAALFVWAGYGKLMDPTGTMALFGRLGLPLPQAAYAVALAIELGVAALMVLGVRTRWMALVLAAWSVATAAIAHLHPGDRGQMLHVYKNVAIAGGMLQVAAFGGGRFALTRK